MKRSAELMVQMTNIKVECTHDTDLSIVWKVIGTSSGDIVYTSSGKTTLAVPPNTLGFERHKVKLTVKPQGMPTKAISLTAPVQVAQSPLTAGLVGGTIKAIPEGSKLVIDASLSIDPDDSTNSGLQYHWSCTTASYDDQAATDVVTATSDDCRTDPAASTFPNAVILEITAATLKPSSAYKITVLVTKGTREAAASQSLVVVSGDPPQVSLE